MEVVMDIVKYIMENWKEALLGVEMLLGGSLLIALIIPGEQPDKFLQGAVDFIKGMSKK